MVTKLRGPTTGLIDDLDVITCCRRVTLSARSALRTTLHRNSYCGRVEAIAGSAGHLCHRDHLVFHLLNFRHQLIERGRLHLAARMHQNDDTVTDVRRVSQITKKSCPKVSNFRVLARLSL